MRTFAREATASGADIPAVILSGGHGRSFPDQLQSPKVYSQGVQPAFKRSQGSTAAARQQTFVCRMSGEPFDGAQPTLGGRRAALGRAQPLQHQRQPLEQSIHGD